MTEQTAERAIVTSAVVVGGTYAYLKFKGKTNTTFGSFATSFGVVFLILSLMSEVSPGFGGSFAILVAAGDLLANIPALTSTALKDQAVAPKSAAKPGAPAAPHTP